MASASSFSMNSTDLIKKESLDYGAFGHVFLCYHKVHGQVVLKTVYTGPQQNERNKQLLIQEGRLMERLNHERIVKLLGVILEDSAYSLIMEFIPRGNLLAMLDKVSVPISIKGRIILEIIEGMVYLIKNNVVHKDLKPENILVDKDFHIKIADLGLSTCQTWSKLTKMESRRRSCQEGQSGGRMAGTLCYMAPEHLDSIHTRSTEKSDIYSFAIVVWVILTCKEPYENAFSEDHICQRVRKGDRPDESLIPADTPAEIVTLMRKCWSHHPNQRPTFAESYESFQPFYENTLQKDVEKDKNALMDVYKGPDDYLEKMKSLKLLPDSPAPLLSCNMVPVEASIDDFSCPVDSPSEAFIRTDAMQCANDNLEQKLAQELNYHKHGSYSYVNQPDLGSLWASPMERDQARRAGVGTRPPSSVQSWNSPEHNPVLSPLNLTPRPNGHQPPGLSPYTGVPQVSPYTGVPPVSPYTGVPPVSPYTGVPPVRPYTGVPPVSPYSPRQCPSLDRHQSWKNYPVPESEAPDLPAGVYNSAQFLPNGDKGSLFIQNASGIQIGNNNLLSIGSQDYSLSSTQASSSKNMYRDLLKRYEDHSVTEAHLDILREKIGTKWKWCARSLGLSEVEVETIEHDYGRDGLKEMVFQMLERWKMKEGFVGCTLGRLCRDLDKIITAELLCQLLQICESSVSP